MNRYLFKLSAPFIAVAVIVAAYPAVAQDAPRARRPGNVTPFRATPVNPSDPITKGQRVFFAGHSFLMFIAGGRDGSEGPIDALAKEAGFESHRAVGRDMIGGSTPMQHWERGGEDNEIKRALRAGDVDVLTLAGNARIPEDGITKFCDLAFEHNPDVRVLVQMSWGTFDGLGSQMDPAIRDDTTFEDLARMKSWIVPYATRMREQLQDINERHGRDTAFVVPAYPAVVNFRKEVLAGRVPGITKQTQLFRDGLGHPKEPLADLVSYVWFACIYRQSPVGLTALDTEETEESKAAHRIMQQVAWEAVLAEPMSGVVLPQKKLPNVEHAGS